MATVADGERRSAEDLIYRFLKTLRGSLLLSIVATGGLLVLIATVFDSSVTITSQDGVIAGMLGVFGVSAIIVAGSFYAGIKLLKRY